MRFVAHRLIAQAQAVERVSAYAIAQALKAEGIDPGSEEGAALTAGIGEFAQSYLAPRLRAAAEIASGERLLVKPGALTQERRKTHGDWPLTARIAGALKSELHAELAQREARGHALDDHQIEALDMILAKIARIVSGDPNHPDHWDDIAGYALLGKGEAS